jgi:hypothetical protein
MKFDGAVIGSYIAFVLLLCCLIQQVYAIERVTSVDTSSIGQDTWLQTGNIRRRITSDEKSQHQDTRTLQDIMTIQFKVYNSVEDKLVTVINDDTVVNMYDLDLSNPESLNFEAVVSPAITGEVRSVRFKLSGATTMQKMEFGAPYTLCGNFGTNFLSCTGMNFGEHTLQASVTKLDGSTISLQKTFKIVNIEPGQPTSTNPTSPPPVFIPANPPTPPPISPVTLAPVIMPTSKPTEVPISVPGNSMCTVPKVGQFNRVMLMLFLHCYYTMK